MPENPLPHQGKLGIVTRASRGIGAAISLNLANKGANLLLNYTSPSSLEKIEAVKSSCLLANPSAQVEVFQADMGSVEGPKALVSFAINTFKFPNGKPQIYIMINVRGPLLLAQSAQPYLPYDRSGRIVNISSVSSTAGYAQQTVYGGTKAALEAMTRSWSRELSTRCTVNAVNPGPVATDMYDGLGGYFAHQLTSWSTHAPLIQYSEEEKKAVGEDAVRLAEKNGGRAAKTEEIAGLVGLLTLPEAGWTTGSVLCANGGMVFSTG
ncbi:NAD(P)-binding protein [Choiromyces venosus 120613-1]|uniref:NAD(P)-binding protein n=1 Tax=Choiromyces venosus 120613-1 TaxID=1336337 RepID=A0A3N4JWF0_9PEZI|nr:NAD(P)-binding protein [Choiromyces venosus 120613-1]